MTASEVIRLLNLVPLEPEGGYFVETYRSAINSTIAGRSHSEEGPVRSLATAIYYLMTPTRFSAWHRLESDEIYHFYAGAPVEQLTLDERTERLERTILSADLAAGHRPQTVVRAGVWQTTRPTRAFGYDEANEDVWSLVGATVSPGFEFDDFTLADRRFVDRFQHLSPAVRERMPREG